MKTGKELENTIIGDMMTLPQMQRGQVWCTKCGRSEMVDSAKCWRLGWPKCCGYTMTIDSPEERKRLKEAL